MLGSLYIFFPGKMWGENAMGTYMHVVYRILCRYWAHCTLALVLATLKPSLDVHCLVTDIEPNVLQFIVHI